MIIYQQITNDGVPTLRVVRKHIHRDRDYYSDCYFKMVSASTDTFDYTGGILYAVRENCIRSHAVLSGTNHPERDRSWESCYEKWGYCFPTELYLSANAPLPVTAILNERNMDIPQDFDNLFQKPHVVNLEYAEKHYRAIFTESDAGHLFLYYLAQNGNIFYQDTFQNSKCLPGQCRKSHIKAMLDRIAHDFTSLDTSYFANVRSLDRLCQISLYVSQGRYIVIGVYYFDKAFRVATDHIDISMYLQQGCLLNHPFE